MNTKTIPYKPCAVWEEDKLGVDGNVRYLIKVSRSGKPAFWCDCDVFNLEVVHNIDQLIVISLN